MKSYSDILAYFKSIAESFAEPTSFYDDAFYLLNKGKVNKQCLAVERIGFQPEGIDSDTPSRKIFAQFWITRPKKTDPAYNTAQQHIMQLHADQVVAALLRDRNETGFEDGVFIPPIIQDLDPESFDFIFLDMEDKEMLILRGEVAFNVSETFEIDDALWK